MEWDLDIDKYELNRTHWALKDVDLFDVLIENGQLPEDKLTVGQPDGPLQRYRQDARASTEVTPTAFRIPAKSRDPRLISVMMPFDADLAPVYATIGNVCRELELECSRADDIFDESEVIQDVFSLIYRSAVVICDFSGSKPNVYYEAGIAHTLGRPVVPLTQFHEHVTFDLRHHRFIQYLNNSEGLQALSPSWNAVCADYCTCQPPDRGTLPGPSAGHGLQQPPVWLPRRRMPRERRAASTRRTTPPGPPR